MDSIGYRIEALRVYLEQQIGDEVLLEVYKYLHENESEDNSEIQKLMGPMIKFLPLLYQMIVCEDTYYNNASI